MKKNSKKLRLLKETLLHLNGTGIRRVVGGGITDRGFTDCTNNTTGGGNGPSTTCFPAASVPESCICDQSNGLVACWILP